MSPKFNDPLRKPVEEWERSAPRRGAGPNPDGLPAKYARIRFNAWEHAGIEQLRLREGLSMQQWVRRLVRQKLFEELGR